MPVEVPTIAVEPPRTPQQMERRSRAWSTGRYAWVIFTSVNAVRAVREKFAEYGLDARALRRGQGRRIGEATADALRAFGIQPDLVPTGEQSTAGLLDELPAYDEILDPIDRVFLPRADIATETLAAGLTELGWEVDDVTAYRTVRAAPPPAEIRDAIKSGGFDAVLFTSSSHRAQPGRHRRQAARPTVVAVHRPEDGQDRRGVRPAGRRAGREPAVAALADALAEARRCAGTPSSRRDRLAPGERRAAAGRREAESERARSGPRRPCGPDRQGGLSTGRPRGPAAPAAPTPAMRRLVAETRLHPAELVLPMFVKEGADRAARRSRRCPAWCSTPATRCARPPREAVAAGVGGLMLFGIPAVEDAVGSGATDPDGILNVAIRDVVAEVGDDLVVMADLCLDEFTDHGHCGVLAADGAVDNDATLERYARDGASRRPTPGPTWSAPPG